MRATCVWLDLPFFLDGSAVSEKSEDYCNIGCEADNCDDFEQIFVAIIQV
jgi:hypothetical protein